MAEHKNNNNPSTESKKQGYKAYYLFSLLSWILSSFDLVITLLGATFNYQFIFGNIAPTFSILAIYGILSLSLLSRFFGSLFWNRYCDRSGRRKNITIMLIIMTIISFLSMFLTNVNSNPYPISIPLLFIITRIITGFCVGALWPVSAILSLEKISEDQLNENRDKFPLTINLFTIKQSIRKNIFYGGLMQSGYHIGWMLFFVMFGLFNWLVPTMTFLPKYPLSFFSFWTLWEIMILIQISIGIFLIIYSRRLTDSDIWRREVTKLNSNVKISKTFGNIQELLFSKRYSKTIISFWLILTGLFYLYYPSTVIAPAILKLENTNPNYGLLDQNSFQYFFYFSLLLAHFLPGFFFYKYYRRGKEEQEPKIKGFFWPYYFKEQNKIFDRSFVILKILKRVLSKIKNALLELIGNKKILPNHDEMDFINFEKNTEQNFDVLLIIIIAFITILISIIGLIVYPIFQKKSDLLIVIYTGIVIFVSNLAWFIIPTMISSRFPTRLRATASGLIYQGGLVIGFGSPFISMAFYFSIPNSPFLLNVPTILGASAMIIGGWSFLKQVRGRDINIQNLKTNQNIDYKVNTEKEKNNVIKNLRLTYFPPDLIREDPTNERAFERNEDVKTQALNTNIDDDNEKKYNNNIVIRYFSPPIIKRSPLTVLLLSKFNDEGETYFEKIDSFAHSLCDKNKYIVLNTYYKNLSNKDKNSGINATDHQLNRVLSSINCEIGEVKNKKVIILNNNTANPVLQSEFNSFYNYALKDQEKPNLKIFLIILFPILNQEFETFLRDIKKEIVISNLYIIFDRQYPEYNKNNDKDNYKELKQVIRKIKSEFKDDEKKDYFNSNVSEFDLTNKYTGIHSPKSLNDLIQIYLERITKK